MERPFTLIAELTYRCPLSCAYCSNPVQYTGKEMLSAECGADFAGSGGARGRSGELNWRRAALTRGSGNNRFGGSDLDLYTTSSPQAFLSPRAARTGSVIPVSRSVQLSIQSAEEETL